MRRRKECEHTVCHALLSCSAFIMRVYISLCSAWGSPRGVGVSHGLSPSHRLGAMVAGGCLLGRALVCYVQALLRACVCPWHRRPLQQRTARRPMGPLVVALPFGLAFSLAASVSAMACHRRTVWAPWSSAVVFLVVLWSVTSRRCCVRASVHGTGASAPAAHRSQAPGASCGCSAFWARVLFRVGAGRYPWHPLVLWATQDSYSSRLLDHVTLPPSPPSWLLSMSSAGRY